MCGGTRKFAGGPNVRASHHQIIALSLLQSFFVAPSIGDGVMARTRIYIFSNAFTYACFTPGSPFLVHLLQSHGEDRPRSFLWRLFALSRRCHEPRERLF